MCMHVVVSPHILTGSWSLQLFFQAFQLQRKMRLETLGENRWLEIAREQVETDKNLQYASEHRGQLPDLTLWQTFQVKVLQKKHPQTLAMLALDPNRIQSDKAAAGEDRQAKKHGAQQAAALAAAQAASTKRPRRSKSPKSETKMRDNPPPPIVTALPAAVADPGFDL
jgi:hypothetical protein